MAYMPCRGPAGDTSSPLALVDTAMATFSSNDNEKLVAAWVEYAIQSPLSSNLANYCGNSDACPKPTVAIWLTQAPLSTGRISAYVYADKVTSTGFAAILQTSGPLDDKYPVSINWIAYNTENPMIDSGVVAKAALLDVPAIRQ